MSLIPFQPRARSDGLERQGHMQGRRVGGWGLGGGKGGKGWKPPSKNAAPVSPLWSPIGTNTLSEEGQS